VIVAGGATALLLPLWLSPLEQGYYFTFISLLAIQILFELGLNQIIVQLVSHEVAFLTEISEGVYDGPKYHLDRLSSLLQLVSVWYGTAAFVFALSAGTAGYLFFIKSGPLESSNYITVWFFLVGCTAINLWLSPRLSVIEGFSKVEQVVRLRIVQAVLGYMAIWCALFAGAGLWAPTALPAINAVCTFCWLRFGQHTHWLEHRKVDVVNRMVWRKDVLPLQWRIASSWISGYLIFNLFTPTVFSEYGAAEAGKLGVALTMFSALSTIGMSWISAKASNFTIHIARGERAELNLLFKRLFIWSTAVTTILCLFVTLIAFYLSESGFPIMTRISSPIVMSMIAITCVANVVIYSMAVYMRSHREEPMVLQSIVVALLIVIGLFTWSKSSVFAIVFMYMCVVIFVSLPWTLKLFISYFRRA